jgi:hypothetical protein
VRPHSVHCNSFSTPISYACCEKATVGVCTQWLRHSLDPGAILSWHFFPHGLFRRCPDSCLCSLGLLVTGIHHQHHCQTRTAPPLAVPLSSPTQGLQASSQVPTSTDFHCHLPVVWDSSYSGTCATLLFSARLQHSLLDGDCDQQTSSLSSSHCTKGAL